MIAWILMVVDFANSNVIMKEMSSTNLGARLSDLGAAVKSVEENLNIVGFESIQPVKEGKQEFACELAVEMPLADGIELPDTVTVTACDDVSVAGNAIHVPVTLSVDGNEQIGSSIGPTGSSVGTGSIEPPHRDPERLREVYESCDSFTEMRDALGTDVTAEAVRQQMIKHGIHEAEPTGPTKYAPNDQVDINTELNTAELLPDGGQQIECDLDRLVDVLSSSNTLHPVQDELGISSEHAHRLLRKLGVLELVTGRLSTAPERNQSREEIKATIREALDDTQ